MSSPIPTTEPHGTDPWHAITLQEPVAVTFQRCWFVKYPRGFGGWLCRRGHHRADRLNPGHCVRCGRPNPLRGSEEDKPS